MALSTFKKQLFTTVAGVALAIGVASTAQASEFQVNPGALGGKVSIFGATSLTGQASELVRPTSTGHTASGYIDYGTIITSGNGKNFSIDAAPFGIYVLFDLVDVSAGPNSTTYNLTSLNYTMWADMNGDDDFNKAGSADGKLTGSAVSITNKSDDVLMATGSFISGQFTLAASGSTSLNPNTTFALTQLGSKFFNVPTSFYNETSNNLSTTDFAGTSSNKDGSIAINSNASTSFNYVVPEPTSVALLGLGMLALSVTARRRKS